MALQTLYKELLYIQELLYSVIHPRSSANKLATVYRLSRSIAYKIFPFFSHRYYPLTISPSNFLSDHFRVLNSCELHISSKFAIDHSNFTCTGYCPNGPRKNCPHVPHMILGHFSSDFSETITAIDGAFVSLCGQIYTR